MSSKILAEFMLSRNCHAELRDQSENASWLMKVHEGTKSKGKVGLNLQSKDLEPMRLPKGSGNCLSWPVGKLSSGSGGDILLTRSRLNLDDNLLRARSAGSVGHVESLGDDRDSSDCIGWEFGTVAKSTS